MSSGVISLRGKSAIVTGSTSGIGLGIAQALADAGAQVMLNGFGTPEQIREAQAVVGAKGGKVLYSGADMTKPDEIARMVSEAKEGFGAVDIMINNAGVQYTSPIEDFPVEKWDMLLSLLLSAAFHTARLTVGDMKKRGWGRIINVSSVHGLVASVNKAPYVSAKHGLIGLTKVIALETAGTGVTANALCPGWVLTPLVQQQIDALALRDGLTPAAATAKLLGEKQPSKTFATSEQLAALAVFLCSDAAAQMTGGALTMDGGWVAQ